MEAFTEVTSTEAFMEAFMEVREVFADVTEAFTEVTSSEAFEEASVEAYMEDTEDMTAFAEMKFTGASTKTSTKAFMDVTTTEAFMEAFKQVMQPFAEILGAYMEDMEYMKASTEVTSTGASTKTSTKASMEVTSTKASMETFMEVLEAFADVWNVSLK